MMLACLLLALTTSALAGSVELLPATPAVADGDTSVRVALRVPGLLPDDKLRLKSSDAAITAVTRGLDGLVMVHITPPEIYRADDVDIHVSVRGSMKLDEDVTVPLRPQARGELKVTFSGDALPAGSKDAVTVNISASGPHPLPDSARDMAVSASLGKLSEVTRAEDGSWTATWTPPAKLADPQNVLFVATDLTAPEAVHGAATFPLLAEKAIEIDAAKGTQNILVIGESQYGPVPAGDDGKARFTALLDPRETSGTLQSVDLTARRTDSTVPLELASQPQMAFAPIAERLPTGQSMRVWLALFEADGRPWSAAAPTLKDGTEGRVEGQGWFSFPVITPTEPGPWTLTASAAEGSVRAELQAEIVDAVPRLTVSADPAALPADATGFTVTVGIKDAAGKGLTKRKLDLSAEGAKASGALKDNGDGTYSQVYKLDKAEQAEVAVRPVLAATGLPPARLVAWASADTLAADGTATVDVQVLALDAFGLPVPNVALKASAPIGDGAVAPDAKTDAYGLATISYRAGTQPGPAALSLDANGLVAITLLWQRAPDAPAFELDPVGDDATVAAIARWRGVAPSVKVGKVGADVGPPAALSLRTVPSYTTPGAAILVTMEVRDAAGKAVLDATPTLNASAGVVGTISNNGDGTFNVPVQLGPGQDGPITLTAGAGSAVGSLNLPTLAQVSTGEATASTGTSTGGASAAPSGGSDAPARVGGGGGEGKLYARVLLADTFYRNSAVALDEDDLFPSETTFTVPAGVIGVAGEVEFFPGSGNIGLDLRFRAGAYKFSVAGETLNDGLAQAMLGGRYRAPIADGVFAYGGLGVHTFDAAYFLYDDTNYISASLQNRRLYGGRLSGGLQVQKGVANLRVELAETFAPLPAFTHAGLALDISVYELNTGSLSLSLIGGLDQQHTRFAANDEGARMRVRARQLHAGLGVGFNM